MPALKPKQSAFLDLDNIPKLIGVISTLIGVLSALYSAYTYLYQQNKIIEETQNKNFREIVANLASEKKAERLASVINLGTFIKNQKNGYFVIIDDSYQNEAIDALVNMPLFETDTDILQVITSSLRKVDPEKYKDLAEKVLKIDRTYFMYGEAIKWRLTAIEDLNNSWNLNHDDSNLADVFKPLPKRINEIQGLIPTPSEKNKTKKEITPDSNHFENILGSILSKTEGVLKQSLENHETKKDSPPDPNTKPDEILAEATLAQYKESLKQEKEFENLIAKNKYRQELISKFAIDLLSVSRKQEISGLELYQNSWNYAVISGLQLPRINIKLSAITSATIQGNLFSEASIQNSTFANSKITNTDFSNSRITATLFTKVSSLKRTIFKKTVFKDVYFALANVESSDFRDTQGLKPIHFFEATNTDKAMFDAQLKEDLDKFNQKSPMEKLKEFNKSVKDSILSDARVKELNKAIAVKYGNQALKE